MKKLIFINSILAIAVIFTYCAKPELEQELKGTGTDVITAERGGPCVITNNPPYNVPDLVFCGTGTNATGCASCVGTPALGVEVFPAGPLSLTVTPPVVFSVRTVNGMPTAVNLTTVNGGPGPITIPAFGCQRFSVDANCNITAIK